MCIRNLKILTKQSASAIWLHKITLPIISCIILLTCFAFYGHVFGIEKIANNNTYNMVEYPLIWSKDKVREEHPLIIELVNSNAFQRLKDVDQSGPIAYFGEMKFFTKYGHTGSMPPFSRYDHSLAVMFLVKRALGIQDLRAANKDQLIQVVAALLHDASHTTFSHVGDHFFAALGENSNTQACYQDNVHQEYLRHFGVDKILQKYDIELEQINPDQHKVLKAPKGTLSADKIQYITHTAVILKIFDQATAQALINDLMYDAGAGEWYFQTATCAKIFGDASIILTKNIYTAPDNYVFYQYFTQALLEGVRSDVLTIDMFKYGTDSVILAKLAESTNPLIKHYLKKLENIYAIFNVACGMDAVDIKVDKLTFRGVDPKVIVGGSVVALSKIDNEFKKNILELWDWCNKGYGIKLHDQEVQAIEQLCPCCK